MKSIVNQHGDCLFEKVDSIPSNAKVAKVNDGFVVEKGEGIHTHVLRKSFPCSARSPLQLADIQNDVEIWTINDDMYIKVKKGKQVVLDHEEHGKQTLKEGIYRKHIEREYSYEDNEERRVID